MRRKPSDPPLTVVPHPAVRCAIYTRKSTDENLDSDFNSLDAQRESAEDYIRSQHQQGWVAVPERYDDGAYSGATLERPALQHLLGDVRAGRIDVILVYKIDRLSRSLFDFAKLIEELERHHVSLVSVTQQFDTSTSVGRLNLHMVLSFCQYERELIAERIRDKMGAARRRGKYLGGIPPLGYDVDRGNKRLVVNAEEAEFVRRVFRRHLQLGSTVALIKELNAEGRRTKAWVTRKGKERPGVPWNKQHVYRLLSNPLYLGKVAYRGTVYDGEHEAIIDLPLWEQVQAALKGNRVVRGNEARGETPAMLRGILRCGHCGATMGITYTKRHGKLYRYYLCQRASKNGYVVCPVRSVSAGLIEDLVMQRLRRVFRTPDFVARTLFAAQRREAADREDLAAEKARLSSELDGVRAAAQRLVDSLKRGDSAFVRADLDGLEAQQRDLQARLAEVDAELDYLVQHPLDTRAVGRQLCDDSVWDNLFPGEQRRIVRLLVKEVMLHPDRVELLVPQDGLGRLLGDPPRVGTGEEPGAPACRVTPGRDGTIVISLPMTFRRRGGRKEIILPDAACDPDEPESGGLRVFLATLARAHRWMRLLEEGKYPTVKALAAAIGLDRSYVAKLLNLTLLAPDLVEAALDGREPDGLSVRSLREGVPVAWEEQLATWAARE
jgi:site-specific DNA recombinase